MADSVLIGILVGISPTAVHAIVAPYSERMDTARCLHVDLFFYSGRAVGVPGSWVMELEMSQQLHALFQLPRPFEDEDPVAVIRYPNPPYCHFHPNALLVLDAPIQQCSPVERGSVPMTPRSQR